MSAECGKCGTDIVYPVGTWPIGECPRCTSDERIALLQTRLGAWTTWDNHRNSCTDWDCLGVRGDSEGCDEAKRLYALAVSSGDTTEGTG